MKKLLLSLLAFMALSVGVQAQEKRCDGAFAVDDVEIAPGEEVTMIFKLTDLLPNAGTEHPGSRGFQLDLRLPDGFTLATDNYGDIDAYMSETQEPNPRRPDWMFYGQIQDNDEQHIRFFCTTMKNILLVEGDVFEVTLIADATVEEGIYNATVSGDFEDDDINISGYVGADTWVQAPFKIRIFVPRLELSEEKSYEEGFDGTLQNVNVTMNTRTLKADTWNTICLPLSIEAEKIADVFGEGNEVKIAEFTGCESKEKDGDTQLTLLFSSTSNGISANTPYLIKVREGISTFTVEGTSFETCVGEPSVEKDGCTFIGNYKWVENLDKAIFISGNKFYVAQGSTRLKSFRGYFTHPALEGESSNPANVSLFVDGEPTGISTLTTNPDNDDVYDLSGRKMNSDKTTLQKGVYIINGKKETVH